MTAANSAADWNRQLAIGPHRLEYTRYPVRPTGVMNFLSWTRILFLAPALALILSASAAANPGEKPARQPMLAAHPTIIPTHPTIIPTHQPMLATHQPMLATHPPMLPAGMARADDPEQVAALEKRPDPAPAAAAEPLDAIPSEQETYHQQRIAYLAKLREEQRERRELEARLEREREARRLAEERAAELQRERRREEIYILHHTIHATQRRLNEEYEREQRLLHLLRHRHRHQPCPAPAPSEDEGSGDLIP